MSATEEYKRVETWNLGNTNHYFTSKKGAGIVVGDTRVTHALTSKLRLFRDQGLTPFGFPVLENEDKAELRP
jgi:hypothetical protein